jgi:hypothetical protein
MKKYLLAVLLLASFQSFGQFLNYTNINGRYKWIAGKFDSTFTIPSGTTPSLRVGGGTGPGALFYRTTDSTVYQYTGTQWIKLRAGVSPTDTAGIWISNVYRQTGTDSVFYVKGGTSTFAFRDSIGNVGGGGGGGKIYYFNGGVNLGTFAGLTMYELGDTAVTSAAANFTRSTTGNLANFITDVNRPGLLQIPAGVWTVDAYLSETGGGSNHAEIWIEVEKWNGSTITTIATSPIEQITNGNVIDLYTWSVSIPTTTLAVTDRIIIQFYITNTNGKTVTLYTQNGYVGEVHTTFTTGIGSLNGLTAPTQYFATGTSGTDFAISSSTETHTFNLPTASGSNRGALSSTDWTTFNGKVGGSGTTNYVPKWTGSTALGNSQIFDNGTNVGIGISSPTNALQIDKGNATASYLQFTAGTTTGQTATDGLIFGIDASGNAVLNNQDNLPIIFSTNNAERMRIQANSFIGIGTSSSSYALQITGLGTDLLYINRSGNYVKFGGMGSGTAYMHAFEGNFAIGNVFSGGNLLFFSGNNERGRFTSNGRLLIGTTTESTYELDVVGDISSTLDANINGLTVGKGGGSIATNTAVGFEAINATNTGGFNVAIGYRALKAYTGDSNVAIGTNALTANTTGNTNVGIGNGAGQFITTGSNNTLIGYGAGFGNITSGNNTVVGGYAGRAFTSASNTFIGASAGRFVTTGGSNSFFGFSSGFGTTTGSSNLFLGNYSGYTITTGGGNTVITPSGDATYPGITTGNYNTIIGAVTGLSSSLSNTIILADGQGNQRLRIDNGGNVGIGTTSPTSYTNFTTLSINNATSGGLIDLLQNGTSNFRILTSTTSNMLNGVANIPMVFHTNGTEKMRLTASGNLLIGTTTDAGYKLDVNGIGRFQISSGVSLEVGSRTATATSTPAMLQLGATYGNNTAGNAGNLKLKIYSTSNTANAQDAGFGISADLLEIQSFADIGFFSGNNLSRTEIMRIKVNGSLGIGTTSPNASALLDVSSTTKGFLPPRMTGAQAEAIATPAAGLLVYANNGNGTTITSTGWWGYDGTNWVKLN